MSTGQQPIYLPVSDACLLTGGVFEAAPWDRPPRSDMSEAFREVAPAVEAMYVGEGEVLWLTEPAEATAGRGSMEKPWGDARAPVRALLCHSATGRPPPPSVGYV